MYPYQKILKNYIQSIIKLRTDLIRIELVNGDQIYSVYIPPSNSPYHDQQSVPTLGTIFIEADKDERSVFAMGDLNARFSELNDLMKNDKYEKNPDEGKNENAKDIINNIFNTSTCTPINHLIKGGNHFGGGITFIRGKKQSQLDWPLCNKNGLTKVESFEVIEQYPNISDHKPIRISITVDMNPSMTKLLKSTQELNNRIQNQSDTPRITADNCDITIMTRLLPIYLEEILTPTIADFTTNEIASKLQKGIHRCGKIAKIQSTKYNEVNEDAGIIEYTEANNFPSIHQIYSELTQNEIEKWNKIQNCNDKRLIWKTINVKGEIKADVESDVNAAEIAEFFKEKFSDIHYKEAFFDEMQTGITDPTQDCEISEKEVTDAIKDMNEGSKTSDGISPSVIHGIITIILPILLMLYNTIFVGGIGSYPIIWICMMHATPKNGILQLPSYIRGISIMSSFAKIYDKILMERLYRGLQIPMQQSAYQKGNGCNLHVAYIRILKEIARRTKVKVFIIFTDFQAAFDLVSRRTLFKKLINLGISTILLNALMAIYSSVQAVVEHNG